MSALRGPYTIAERDSLTLQATAPGSPSSYAWDINGDGKFTDATGANPTLTWTQLQALLPAINDIGTFHPQVSVRYLGATVTSAKATLTVTETPPTATVSNSGPVAQGSATPVTVTGNSVSNAALAAGLTYEYDFNADGVIDQIDRNVRGADTVTVPAAAILDHGSYAVSGLVLDKNGGSAAFQTTVVVSPVPEVLTVTGANTIPEGSPYSLSLTAAHPQPESVQSWVVDWNDGTVQTFQGKTQDLTHVYATPGAYVIGLQAVDRPV